MANYFFYKRKTAIIFTDALILSVGLSIWGYYTFKYNWSVSIVTFLILFFGTNYVFFSSKIFRYIFSIIFSLFYALIFAAIGAYIDKENPTMPSAIFGILAFLISLFLHKDHFDFLKGAKPIEYENY